MDQRIADIFNRSTAVSGKYCPFVFTIWRFDILTIFIFCSVQRKI
jgi:hypothetical protein